VVISLLALGTSAWWLWPKSEDPQVTKVKEMQAKLFSGSSTKTFAPPANKQEAEERRQQFAELRKEAEKLTPEQQKEMMKTPPAFVQQMQAEIEKFALMKAADRKKYLDKRIDEMEGWRKLMQPVAAIAGAAKGGAGAAKSTDDGQRRPFGGMSRDDWRRNMLDNSSPKQRAQMSEFFREFQIRLSQRGMEPLPMPRF